MAMAHTDYLWPLISGNKSNLKNILDKKRAHKKERLKKGHKPKKNSSLSYGILKDLVNPIWGPYGAHMGVGPI
jgi:hypothetical protein